MQQRMVIFALVLYAAFAFRPIVELPIFSRTLNLSPGDMVTILLVMGIFVKALLQNKHDIVIRRPPAVFRFFLAYIFLAVVFFIPTVLFFIMYNEMVQFLPRTLYTFLLWSISLVLFYYGTESNLKVKELRLIVWLLMVTFLGGVLWNIFSVGASVNFPQLMSDVFSSQGSRFFGQTDDPNQLGALSAFFSIIGIMGMLYEEKTGAKLFFSLLAVGAGLTMLLTQSREAILTAFVSVLSIIILLIRTKMHLKAFFLSLVLTLGSILSVINIPRIATTISAIKAGEASDALSGRDQVWSITWDLISNHPFGIGYANMDHITNGAAVGAHNAFLEAAVVSGFLGVIAFTCFLWLLFKMFLEQKKLASENWMLDAYLVFSVGYLATSVWSAHFISFYVFNAIFYGLLGFVACARQ